MMQLRECAQIARVFVHGGCAQRLLIQDVHRHGPIEQSVVTAERMAAFNDFGKAPEVKPADFNGAKVENGKLAVDLPAKSVVTLRIEL